MPTIDFEELLQYALRAQLTYAIAKPGWYITEQLGWRSSCPYQINIEEVPKVNVNAIVELNHTRQVQWIAVRGTDNLTNWLLDLDYIEKCFTQETGDREFKIDLHNGFYQASVAVWEVIRPHLHQNYQTRITGHSLGGAIAAILMMFVEDAGYSLDKCITFGQPKITNSEGAAKAAHLPLLRVVNQEDVVPLVPPNSLLNLLRGEYVHFGCELQLEPNGYVFRSEHNHRSLTKGFWWRLLNEKTKNILGDVREHYIQNYLHNLTNNLESSEQTKQELVKNSSNFQTAASNLQLSQQF